MSSESLAAGCLCGSVRWEVDGPFGSDAARGERTSELDQTLSFTHCHCSRCRKTHGAPFASYGVVRHKRFRLTQGHDGIESFASSPGVARAFCRTCGSVVPDGNPSFGRVGVPVGSFDQSPEARPTAHIFTGSKAPWSRIQDELPRFDTYPPGVPVSEVPSGEPLASRDGKPRGSCLCGGVAYVVEKAPLRCRTCHCQRCRKAASAAHVSYLVTELDGIRVTRGEELLAVHKLAEARYFKHAFCRRCGSAMPRFDAERGIAILAMGSLDDDPGVRPSGHIFVESKAAWDVIDDGLPQYAGYAPE